MVFHQDTASHQRRKGHLRNQVKQDGNVVARRLNWSAYCHINADGIMTLSSKHRSLTPMASSSICMHVCHVRSICEVHPNTNVVSRSLELSAIACINNFNHSLLSLSGTSRLQMAVKARFRTSADKLSMQIVKGTLMSICMKASLLLFRASWLSGQVLGDLWQNT